MMLEMTCDLCGSPMNWSQDQQVLDLTLRLKGFGLGAMCDACGDRAAEIALADMAEDEDDE